jgi:hypothetical protein
MLPSQPAHQRTLLDQPPAEGHGQEAHGKQATLRAKHGTPDAGYLGEESSGSLLEANHWNSNITLHDNLHIDIHHRRKLILG